MSDIMTITDKDFGLDIVELNNPKYSLLNAEDYKKHAHILALCDGD